MATRQQAAQWRWLVAGLALAGLLLAATCSARTLDGRVFKRDLSHQGPEEITANRGPAGIQSTGIGVQHMDVMGTLFWVTQITMGANQSFRVLVDTGSSDLWLPSVECTSEECLERHRYDFEQSPTCTFSNNRTIDIHYGADSRVRGVEAKDSLELAGMRIEGQSFLFVKQVRGKAFRNLKFDGLLGLGFKFASRLSALSPFEQMIERKLIASQVFSMAPERRGDPSRGGRLVFGSAGADYHPAEFMNVSLVDNRHWEFELSGISLVSQSVQFEIDGPPRVLFELCTRGHERCTAIADSGTALILGPSRKVEQLNLFLGAESRPEGLAKFANCQMTKDFPSLVFRINKLNELELTPEKYVLERAWEENGVRHSSCYSALVPTDDYPFWVLGNIFLNNFNTLYDYANKRVGFAHLHSDLV